MPKQDYGDKEGEGFRHSREEGDFRHSREGVGGGSRR